MNRNNSRHSILRNGFWLLRIRGYVFFAALILNGCTSNFYIENEKLSDYEYHYPHTVYIKNNEQIELSTSIINSGVFLISDNYDSEYKFLFLSGNSAYNCGLVGLGSMLTLGLLPVFYNHEYQFFYEITHDGITERFLYKVPLYSRLSIWEWFLKPFSNSREELIVKNLKYLSPKSISITRTQ